eukprot:53312-Eustigmatos_ZCMA.PRE.1
MLIFYNECTIPEMYGILGNEMVYYTLFAIYIIPFAMLQDVVMVNTLELVHGWKIYDYLIYTRYRFLQRETRWKGMEDTLDECIDDSMRTLDQMCFSSQYYTMLAMYVNGLFFAVLGMEMMIRSDYNI